jgi:hypothetical protein
MNRIVQSRDKRAWCGAAALACLAACMGGPGVDLDSGMGEYLAPKATIRLVSMSVPPGSTLVVRTIPLGPPESQGQEVPELWATVGITSDTNVRGAAIQVFVATSRTHCIGATTGTDLQAGVEAIVTTPRMNYMPAYGDPPACSLPYTTTEVRAFVLRGTCDFCQGGEWASARFPTTYHFLAP